MASGVGDGEFGFQIAPMLDILFVLLLFFMVTAGAQKHEASLTTQLPGGKPGGDVPLEIGIDADGQVNVSGVPVGDPDDQKLAPLVDRLTQVLASNATQPVVLTPMRSTKQQRVVDVLNACAAAKVKNLAFGSPPD
ncbi:MAG TPA: biopolymer transporter ExbD [Candidatus Methylacidiphilales bacterium]|jgi:biopolymer transport protein ExbD|nr:biopolymer transporter ExbD [Candidatus Methylacidiphilales bacterium]